MSREGYKTRSLKDQTISKLRRIAADYQAAHGVELTDPGVIDLLTDFYEKNAKVKVAR